MRTLGQAILLVLTIVALAAPTEASYDARGKVTSIIDGVVLGEDRSFGYDGNGRLLTSTGPWGSGSYGYDALGNVRTIAEGASTTTVSYDANNRVSTAAVTGQALRSFAYDDRGDTANDGRRNFVYDFAGSVKSVSGLGSPAWDHDANLKRVKQTGGGKTIYTLYSRVGGGLIYKDEMTDGKTTAYLSAGGASVRLVSVGGGAAVPTYLHTDHLGSSAAATDAAGAIAWRESYHPFGKLRLAPAANDNNTGYTGHLQDKYTSLVYMQARHYDPVIGRFLSTDPIGYQDQLNLYAYVYNDPINATDPTGECGPLSHICAGAAIGAVGGFVSYAIETAGTGEFTAGGALANAAKGAAVGVAVASGAGLGVIAGVGAVSNVVEDAATAVSSKDGVSEGIAEYTDGPGGAAGALAQSAIGGAVEAVVGGGIAKLAGGAVTSGIKGAALSSQTATTDAARGAISGLAEPIGDLAGEAGVAAGQRVNEEIHKDQLRHSD